MPKRRTKIGDLARLADKPGGLRALIGARGLARAGRRPLNSEENRREGFEDFCDEQVTRLRAKLQTGTVRQRVVARRLRRDTVNLPLGECEVQVRK